ncbi:hypothetical protein CYMTET_9629 [Cymbomonas tetramitiformis]|uniref:Uncharacterized protein n=1 Tax=Cymbomonas tetramitiformis TaxID=36881 RepID=A0AAE0GQT7_9CHLO|nr:hypothetical protein CYMTET_9629 [Cymbomonas tetramitiformis]
MLILEVCKGHHLFDELLGDTIYLGEIILRPNRPDDGSHEVRGVGQPSVGVLGLPFPQLGLISAVANDVFRRSTGEIATDPRSLIIAGWPGRTEVVEVLPRLVWRWQR